MSGTRTASFNAARVRRRTREHIQTQATITTQMLALAVGINEQPTNAFGGFRIPILSQLQSARGGTAPALGTMDITFNSARRRHLYFNAGSPNIDDSPGQPSTGAIVDSTTAMRYV